jgi:hypothetical protein
MDTTKEQDMTTNHQPELPGIEPVSARELIALEAERLQRASDRYEERYGRLQSLQDWEDLEAGLIDD